MKTPRHVDLQESYQQLIVKADTLMQDSRFDEAREVYERVVHRLGRLSQDTLSKRTDLKSLFVRAVVNANILARYAGKFEDALSISGRLGASLPQEDDVAGRLQAETLSDAGRHAEALALLEELSLRSTVSPRTKLGLAFEALMGKNPETALRLMPDPDADEIVAEEGTTKEEIQGQIWFFRAQVLSELGRLDEAVGAWEKTREIAGKEAVPARLMVEMFIAHDDMQKALEYADGETDPLSRGFLRGLVALLTGKSDWANDEWWRVVREKYDVQDPHFFDWLECALRLEGTEEKTKTALQDKMQAEGQFVPRLIMYRGIWEARHGDLNIALAVFRRLIELQDYYRVLRQRVLLDSDRWLIMQALRGETREQVKELLLPAIEAATAGLPMPKPAPESSSSPEEPSSEPAIDLKTE